MDARVGRGRGRDDGEVYGGGWGTWGTWGHGGTWGRSWEERGEATTMLTTNIPDPPPNSPRNKACREETKPYSTPRLYPRSTSRLRSIIRTQHLQPIFFGASNSDITTFTISTAKLRLYKRSELERISPFRCCCLCLLGLHRLHGLLWGGCCCLCCLLGHLCTED